MRMGINKRGPAGEDQDRVEVGARHALPLNMAMAQE